jgi:hypothetical protein
MKCRQIAGNNRINSMIYHCFEYICEDDRRNFAKKFRKQSHDSDQIMHTFKELVLGSYLASRGFNVRHDYVVGDKTPDWIILDSKGESVACIIELTNFHIDRATEKEIEEHKCPGRAIIYWRDQNTNNLERLFQVICNKATVYRTLIKKLGIPYVIGVFCDVRAAVDFEEMGLCLFDRERGLFSMHPEVSGVLHFEENTGRYSFNYANNPNALRPIELPAGVFPSEVA